MCIYVEALFERSKQEFMQLSGCEGNRKVVLLLEIRRESFWGLFEKLVESV